MLNLQNADFKSLDDLKSIAPSIFTSKGSEDTSEKYIHIPTNKVIRDMELLGWGVIDAKEVKARKRVGFQKHLVVFRNPDVVIEGNDGDNVFPQILLTNSHDGKNSFSFRGGLFRMICENGLVVSTEEFSALKIRHIGYDFETLQKTIKEIVEQLPLTVESMNKMKKVELDEQQAFDFAKSLLEIRIDSSNILDQSVQDVLLSQRKQDEGLGLWEVFNRIQENIIEGNFSHSTPSGKIRKARYVKNFQQDLDLNSKMFSKALELV